MSDRLRSLPFAGIIAGAYAFEHFDGLCSVGESLEEMQEIMAGAGGIQKDLPFIKAAAKNPDAYPENMSGTIDERGYPVSDPSQTEMQFNSGKSGVVSDGRRRTE